jgi:hypothetical protein
MRSAHSFGCFLIGADYLVDSHLCLFNTEPYHRLNLQPPQSYLRIDYQDDGRLVGSCAGVLDDGVFDCGHRAPFGGIDVSGDYQSPGKVACLVAQVVSEARARGAKKIRIRCRPHYIHPMESTIQFVLFTQGFRVEHVELSQGIELSTTPNIEEYVNQLQSRTRNKLRNAIRLGIQPVRASTDADWMEGYNVLQGNRAIRHRSRLKYSLDYLHRLRILFAEQVRLLLLRHGGRAVAAALVYRILPGVHYLAAWGDAGHALPYSPMNLMAYEVVNEALNKGARVVDLGISSADGVANEGLVQFKRHVGGSTALRLNLFYEL